MPFFNKIRKNEIKTDGMKRYLLYAVGEIVLVVAGILIALQLNDWDMHKASEIRELHYLKAIRLDLQMDLKRLAELEAFRIAKKQGNTEILHHLEGEPIYDLTRLTKLVIQSLKEQTFTPNNNTYLEMVSSGNLNVIQSDSVRLLLLDLEGLNKTNRFYIEHETFDYREYISKPAFNELHISKMFPVFTGEKTANQQRITKSDFDHVFSSQAYKNGILVNTITGQTVIELYRNITSRSRLLINLIEKQIGQ